MPRESIVEADSKCQLPGVNLPGVFKVDKQVQSLVSHEGKSIGTALLCELSGAALARCLNLWIQSLALLEAVTEYWALHI